jgi:hypothetical protein
MRLSTPSLKVWVLLHAVSHSAATKQPKALKQRDTTGLTGGVFMSPL